MSAGDGAAGDATGAVQTGALPTGALLTVSSVQDLGRLELLLRSLQATGSTFDHFVVVDTEDLAAFRHLESPNVSFLTTADVLPADVEKARRGIRRRYPEHWIRRARGQATHIHGWFAQQLVKLAASASLADREAVLIVDSDLVAIDTVRLDSVVGRRPRVLYALADTDAEMGSWVLDALRFLDVPLQRTPLLRYTFEPVLVYPSVVRELRDFIEARHDAPWLEAIQRADLKEYSLYGAFFDFCATGDRPRHEPPMSVRRVSFADEYQDLLDGGLPAHPDGDGHRPPFIVVHSRLGHDPAEYQHLFEETWAVSAGRSS